MRPSTRVVHALIGVLSIGIPVGTVTAISARSAALRPDVSVRHAPSEPTPSALSQESFDDYLSSPANAGSTSTFYYFTCNYGAWYYDDLGPLSIDVLVEALAPGGVAGSQRTVGSGHVSISVVGTVPLSELSSEDYACHSQPIDPAAAERYEYTKIACEDERNDLLREYGEYGVTWVPSCEDYATSGGSSNFGWNELNGGFSTGNPHYPWGIIQSSLTNGLEATRWNYGAAIYLSSGYRCPHGNYQVDGAPQSLHMQGRAADMYKNAEHSWTEQEFNILKAAADATGPTESFFYNTYADHHYHAAW